MVIKNLQPHKSCGVIKHNIILELLNILHLHDLICWQFKFDGWCDKVGSAAEVQARMLKRQEAAAKREKARAYALARQVIKHLFIFNSEITLV